MDVDMEESGEPEAQEEVSVKDADVDSPSKRKSHRKRKQKDPDAPTRPRSAYLLFLLAKNQEIRNSMGADKSSVADVTRLVGAAWQKISEEENAVFQARAEEDKKRYEEEMRLYTQSDSHRKFKANQSPKGSNADKNHRNRHKQHDSVSSSSTLEPKKRRNGSGGNQRSKGTASSSPEIVDPSRKRFVSGMNSFLTPTPNAVNLNSNSLQELKIPIFNEDFIEWNTHREKELRRIRHLAHELEIDVAGLKHNSDQVSRFAEDASDSETNLKLEQTRLARAEVSKILVEEFEDFELPNGLRADEDNIEYIMTQVEIHADAKPCVDAQRLQGKLRRLAPRLKQFMIHL